MLSAVVPVLSSFTSEKVFAFPQLVADVPVRIQPRLPRAYLRRHGIKDLSGVCVDITAPPRLAVCDRVPFEISRIRVSQFQVDEDANRRRKYFNLKAGVSAVADKIKQELSPFRSAAAEALHAVNGTGTICGYARKKST